MIIADINLLEQHSGTKRFEMLMQSFVNANSLVQLFRQKLHQGN